MDLPVLFQNVFQVLSIVCAIMLEPKRLNVKQQLLVYLNHSHALTQYHLAQCEQIWRSKTQKTCDHFWQMAKWLQYFDENL